MQKISFATGVNEASAATAEDFIAKAREFAGSPYRTQGRTPKGFDCGGLLLRCGNDLDVTDLKVLGYSNQPDGETFERLLDETLTEVKKDEPMPGDILAFDYGHGIQHTAIVTQTDPRLTVIHAQRTHGVIEQGLTSRYRRAWVKTYRLRHLA